MSEKLLIHCPANPGYNRILNTGERGMKLTGFGLLRLRHLKKLLTFIRWTRTLSERCPMMTTSFQEPLRFLHSGETRRSGSSSCSSSSTCSSAGSTIR